MGFFKTAKFAPLWSAEFKHFVKIYLKRKVALLLGCYIRATVKLNLFK